MDAWVVTWLADHALYVLQHGLDAAIALAVALWMSYRFEMEQDPW